MNVLDDIRLYTLARKLYAETKLEATTMTGTKPGWKTSEFWITLLVNTIGVLGVLQGSVPPADAKYVVMALTVLNSVYTVARTFIKQTASVDTTTVAGPATVTTTTTKP